METVVEIIAVIVVGSESSKGTQSCLPQPEAYAIMGSHKGTEYLLQPMVTSHCPVYEPQQFLWAICSLVTSHFCVESNCVRQNDWVIKNSFCCL